MAEPATTADPDPRLLVDGRLLRPERIEGRSYRFSVPANISEIRIVSRSVIPARLDPASSDERRLGISVLEITIRTENLEITVRPDDPALVEGFHAVEPGHRWTDGRALLPAELFTPFNEGFTLELVVNETPLLYPLI